MAAPMSPEDRVLLPTRIVSLVIVPFLILAFLVLFPWPSDTKRLFAWQIKPTMSAMVLGAVYCGGAYFFLRAASASQWHTIAAGFLPVATFASLMGITTILHWNRFQHGHPAFWLWVALYFTTPFMVFAVFLYNRREYVPSTGNEPSLSATAAGAIVTGGGLSVFMSAFLYLFPHKAISIWPWQLTPLTARTLGAVFALGGAGLGAIRERRWSATRILLQVEAVMLLLILIAGLRARRNFDQRNALSWVFAAGFIGTAVATLVLYVRMDRVTARSVTRGCEPGRLT
jgi:hypothetical protein